MHYAEKRLSILNTHTLPYRSTHSSPVRGNTRKASETASRNGGTNSRGKNDNNNNNNNNNIIIIYGPLVVYGVWYIIYMVFTEHTS